MPQQDQSSKLGHSSSPLVDSNLRKDNNSQNKATTTAQAALAQKHTDTPFKK